MCGDLFSSFFLLFIYWDCLTQLQVKADASITSRGNNNFTQIMLVVMHARHKQASAKHYGPFQTWFGEGHVIAQFRPLLTKKIVYPYPVSILKSRI